MKDLRDAIQQKDMAKIKQLLSQPNVKSIINQPDKDHQSALFTAGLHQDQQFGLQVVNMLLQKDADPYHKQDNQQTVIFWLAANNKPKILQRMLEIGYNLNENDKFGQTPLFFAALHGRLKCAELLIKNGCNVNHLDNNGQTSLFYSAKAGHLEMCKQLVNRGCNPALVDKYKKTAAFFAKAGHHSHIVDYLNMFKKQKDKKAASNSQSIQIQKKGKKKQLPKAQYMLVFTGQDGQTKKLQPQQLQEFLRRNSKISSLLQNRQQLQQQSFSQASFLKTALRQLTALLKRTDTILFHQPVKYQQLGLHDYPSIIKNPMDFSTIKHKLNHNCYSNYQQFSKDIYLVYDNCVAYNGRDSVFGKLAIRLKEEYSLQAVDDFANN